MTDEIEKARMSLNIPGYVHPEKKSASVSTYRVFSGNEYNVNPTSNVYSRMDDYKSTDSLTNWCPVCHKKAIYSCTCEDHDMLCPDNHVWYLKNDQIVIGDPHDSD